MALSKIQGSITVNVQGNNTKVIGPSTYQGPINVSFTQNLLPMLAGGTINRIYLAQLTLSGATTLTLNNSTLLNGYGETVNFSNVQMFYVDNLPPTSGAINLTVGGGASGFITAQTLTSPGMTCNFNTVPVTNSTCNVLLTPSGGTTVANVVIYGQA